MTADTLCRIVSAAPGQRQTWKASTPGLRVHESAPWLNNYAPCDYPTAADRFRERIRLVARTDSSRALLAVALGHLGELDEARRVWRELKAIKPNYDLDAYLKKLPWRPADLAAIRAGLAKAGLPE